MHSYYITLLRAIQIKIVFNTKNKLKKAFSTMSSMSHSHNFHENLGYEEAVTALLQLQSNAEVIEKIRQNRDQKKHLNIPNMNKYISRSGLTVEQVDGLSVIHVSGTKGKGSTCAFCERILGCQGYKTGLFTSPHLIEVRERIRLNGEPISKEMFSEYFWRVYNRLKATQTENVDEGGGMPAYFAFLTVLSLHVFISEHVDIAIMEVGIGGQYDSTNFIRRPSVCGVTSLGLDHTAILGNTLEEIAWNKAGIFKRNCPAITVPQDVRALKVLQDRAIEIMNPLYIAEPVPREVLDSWKISLGIAGDKQAENAALAIQLCKFWKQRQNHRESSAHNVVASHDGKIPVLTVDTDVDDDTKKGLSSCKWPGRAQTISREHVTYYLDGAHTLESMEVCASWFKNAADKEKQLLCDDVSRILIFNSTGDRDVRPFLQILKNCNFNAAVFCTNITSTSPALNRTDQINRTVTPKSMVLRCEANKAVWDSLTSSCQNHISTDVAVKSEESMLMENLDHNFNSKVEVPVNKVNSSVSVDKKDCDESLLHQPNGSYVLCNGLDTRISSYGGLLGNAGDATTLLDKLGARRGHSGETKTLSYFFHSILEALAWATQGRDPIIGVGIVNGTLPDVDPRLKKQQHVQILATGSLHLVGGVLGIVAPNLND